MRRPDEINGGEGAGEEKKTTNSQPSDGVNQSDEVVVLSPEELAMLLGKKSPPLQDSAAGRQTRSSVENALRQAHLADPGKTISVDTAAVIRAERDAGRLKQASGAEPAGKKTTETASSEVTVLRLIEPFRDNGGLSISNGSELRERLAECVAHAPHAAFISYNNHIMSTFEMALNGLEGGLRQLAAEKDRLEESLSKQAEIVQKPAPESGTSDITPKDAFIEGISAQKQLADNSARREWAEKRHRCVGILAEVMLAAGTSNEPLCRQLHDLLEKASAQTIEILALKFCGEKIAAPERPVTKKLIAPRASAQKSPDTRKQLTNCVQILTRFFPEVSEMCSADFKMDEVRKSTGLEVDGAGDLMLQKLINRLQKAEERQLAPDADAREKRLAPGLCLILGGLIRALQDTKLRQRILSAAVPITVAQFEAIALIIDDRKKTKAAAASATPGQKLDLADMVRRAAAIKRQDERNPTGRPRPISTRRYNRPVDLKHLHTSTQGLSGKISRNKSIRMGKEQILSTLERMLELQRQFESDPEVVGDEEVRERFVSVGKELLTTIAAVAARAERAGGGHISNKSRSLLGQMNAIVAQICIRSASDVQLARQFGFTADKVSAADTAIFIQLEAMLNAPMIRSTLENLPEGVSEANVLVANMLETPEDERQEEAYRQWGELALTNIAGELWGKEVDLSEGERLDILIEQAKDESENLIRSDAEKLTKIKAALARLKQAAQKDPKAGATEKIVEKKQAQDLEQARAYANSLIARMLITPRHLKTPDSTFETVFESILLPHIQGAFEAAEQVDEGEQKRAAKAFLQQTEYQLTDGVSPDEEEALKKAFGSDAERNFGDAVAELWGDE